MIDDAGYGEYFIHRTGHGIGLEAHEDPYIVEGNSRPLEAGHAFSIEPGIYIPGKWGMRLEDIAAATADGPVHVQQLRPPPGLRRRLSRADDADGRARSGDGCGGFWPADASSGPVESPQLTRARVESETFGRQGGF